MAKRVKVTLFLCSLLLTSCDIRIGFSSSHSASVSSSSPSIITSTNSGSSTSTSGSTSTSVSSSVSTSSSTSVKPSTSVSISTSASTSTSVHEHLEDPYTHILTNEDRIEFYKTYHEACCYEDAQYRTIHGLLSGDIEDQNHLPVVKERPKDSYGRYYRLSDAHYTYRKDGSFESYTTNTIDGTPGRTIYYNGAYASLNDVAAYLLAFGETPPNTIADKNAKTEAVENWWKFGRVNDSYYSNDVSKFPYEPELPYDYYYETDFGATGTYKVGSYTETTYNNGNKINGRMACRFVYTHSSTGDINSRRVFYTYNHYNDFQEYLNYDFGFGARFGNETAGNEPDDSVYSNPPTSYEECTIVALRSLI